jgi:hypothetical protein
MIDNRLQFTDAVTKAEFITTTNHGLEKIKPIAHELTRMSFTTADMNIALKLSEVIEKVNRIIDILNQGVKGNENKSYKIT